jgi:hypothetical protein
VISGAGPTVLVLRCAQGDVDQVRLSAPEGWACHDLGVDGLGARVLPGAKTRDRNEMTRADVVDSWREPHREVLGSHSRRPTALVQRSLSGDDIIT